MLDELKQYVDIHRDELELHQPREQLWDGIEDRLHGVRSRKRWQWLAAAASILLVLSCGTWIFISERQQRAREAASLAPRLNEVEVYSAALLNLRDEEFQQYCNPQPELCREFELDLESLLREYRQLKIEYAASADKQEILRAMSANLQMQVQLINQQLHIMEQVQKKKETFKTI